MRNLGLAVLVLMLTSMAGASPFAHGVDFAYDELTVHFVNYEVPRSKPYLIAHFRVANLTKEEKVCDWRSLSCLRRADGEVLWPNYDALVDLGHGMTRTNGPFVMALGQKATIAVLFMLGPQDLPGKLVLADGQESIMIEFRK